MKEKSIKINAILNIIYTISNIIFPVITFPYVSRILSVDGLGKVSFFSAIANYAIMFASQHMGSGRLQRAGITK